MKIKTAADNQWLFCFGYDWKWILFCIKQCSDEIFFFFFLTKLWNQTFHQLTINKPINYIKKAHALLLHQICMAPLKLTRTQTPNATARFTTPETGNETSEQTENDSDWSTCLLWILHVYFMLPVSRCTNKSIKFKAAVWQPLPSLQEPGAHEPSSHCKSCKTQLRSRPWGPEDAGTANTTSSVCITQAWERGSTSFL